MEICLYNSFINNCRKKLQWLQFQKLQRSSLRRWVSISQCTIMENILVIASKLKEVCYMNGIFLRMQIPLRNKNIEKKLSYKSLVWVKLTLSTFPLKYSPVCKQFRITGCSCNGHWCWSGRIFLSSHSSDYHSLPLQV